MEEHIEKPETMVESEEESKRESRAYRFMYSLVEPICALLYPMRTKGRENIPEGPAIVCATHSNYIDPVLAAFAFTKKHFLHFMAKNEFRKAPVLGRLFSRVGVFFVNRGKNDIGAIRSAMKYLKRGEKVLMFPEGTRVSEDNAVDAKTGAVRIASKLHVPIVPVFIPRRKSIFKKVDVCIGEPIQIDAKTHEEYVAASDEIMERIYALRDKENDA